MDVELLDERKASDMIYAARQGDVDAVRVCLERGANPSLPNRLRFMLQEVMELRRGNWVMRKPDPAAQQQQGGARRRRGRELGLQRCSEWLWRSASISTGPSRTTQWWCQGSQSGSRSWAF